jgi:hypothetical protein
VAALHEAAAADAVARLQKRRPWQRHNGERGHGSVFDRVEFGVQHLIHRRIVPVGWSDDKRLVLLEYLLACRL